MKRFYALTALTTVLLWSAVSAQNPKDPPELSHSETIDASQLLADLEILSSDDLEGRLTGSKGNAKAREYVVRRFKESAIIPFRDSYLQPFAFSPRNRNPSGTLNGVNVVGYVKGNKTPDRFLVITAHYDHIGIRNGQIYNGANDNASGSAALFALGAYFDKHRTDNSILFAAFDAEEEGLVGSREFLRDPPVAKDAMIMNINLDMICRDRTRTLYAVGTYPYPQLRPILQTVLSRAKVKLALGHDNPALLASDDWTSDSDHLSFHRQNIPFIYFGVEDYEYHHAANDESDNIMPAFYVGAVETIIDAVQEFDRHSRDIRR